MTAISALAYFPKGIPPFQKKKKKRGICKVELLRDGCLGMVKTFIYLCTRNNIVKLLFPGNLIESEAERRFRKAFLSTSSPFQFHFDFTEQPLLFHQPRRSQMFYRLSAFRLTKNLFPLYLRLTSNAGYIFRIRVNKGGPTSNFLARQHGGAREGHQTSDREVTEKWTNCACALPFAPTQEMTERTHSWLSSVVQRWQPTPSSFNIIWRTHLVLEYPRMFSRTPG